MAVDYSNYKYICPICDDGFGSQKAVKRHVTNSTENGHHNVNGFTMNKTIERKQDDEQNTLTDKIVKAADKFDVLDNQATKQVARLADEQADNHNVSKKEVARAWLDAGYELHGKHTETSTRFRDLTLRQKGIVASAYDLYGANPASYTMTYSDVAENVNLPTSNVAGAARKYEFFLKNKYLPSEIQRDGYLEEIKQRLIESDIDTTEQQPEDDSDIVDNIEQEETTDNGEQDNTTMEDFDTELTNDVIERVAALDEIGADYEVTLEIEDDKFDIIKRLIQNGFDEVAENMYNE